MVSHVHVTWVGLCFNVCICRYGDFRNGSTNGFGYGRRRDAY